MKKTLLSFFILLTILATVVYAAFYPSGQDATDPQLLVGREADGTYTPVKVDSSGNVFTSGGSGAWTDTDGGVTIAQNVTIDGSLSVNNELTAQDVIFIGLQSGIRDNGGGDIEFTEDSGATWNDIGSSTSEWTDQGTYIDHQEDDVYVLKDLSIGEILTVGKDVTIRGCLTVTDGFYMPPGPTGTYDIIHTDKTNAYVGIGTSTPAAVLMLDRHTDFNSNTELHIRCNDANYDTVIFLQGTTGNEGIKWWYDNNTGKVYWDSVLDGYEHYWRDNNSDTMMTLHSGDLTVANNIEATSITEGGVAVYNDDEMDTFSELNAIVTNKTLVNEEDAITFDSLITLDDSLTVAKNVTISNLVSPSVACYFVVADADGELGKSADTYQIGSASGGATTDGGAVTYVTGTTDDFAIGGTDATAPFFFDESGEDLSISDFLSVGGDTTVNGVLHIQGNSIHVDNANNEFHFQDQDLGFSILLIDDDISSFYGDLTCGGSLTVTAALYQDNEHSGAAGNVKNFDKYGFLDIWYLIKYPSQKGIPEEFIIQPVEDNIARHERLIRLIAGATKYTWLIILLLIIWNMVLTAIIWRRK